MSRTPQGRRQARRREAERRRRQRMTAILVIAVIVLAVLLIWRFLPHGDEQVMASPSPAPSETVTPSTAPTPTPTPEPSPDPTLWNLRLVNATHALPDDFTVEVTKLRSGHAIDSRAYPDLQDMMDAARSEGLSPIICSSFRTMETQQRLFQNQIDAYVSRGYSQDDAAREAAVWVAIPGTSEHQLGLAVDIVDESYQLLDEQQEQTPVQQWLMAHCHEYGFVLRYPTDKSEITGIGYEPWHYRYVGKEAAAEIMAQGLCLEEYLGETG